MLPEKEQHDRAILLVPVVSWRLRTYQREVALGGVNPLALPVAICGHLYEALTGSVGNILSQFGDLKEMTSCKL